MICVCINVKFKCLIKNPIFKGILCALILMEFFIYAFPALFMKKLDLFLSLFPFVLVLSYVICEADVFRAKFADLHRAYYSPLTGMLSNFVVFVTFIGAYGLQFLFFPLLTLADFSTAAFAPFAGAVLVFLLYTLLKYLLYELVHTISKSRAFGIILIAIISYMDYGFNLFKIAYFYEVHRLLSYLPFADTMDEYLKGAFIPFAQAVQGVLCIIIAILVLTGFILFINIRRNSLDYNEFVGR